MNPQSSGRSATQQGSVSERLEGRTRRDGVDNRQGIVKSNNACNDNGAESRGRAPLRGPGQAYGGAGKKKNRGRLRKPS